jgi:hypothetical protein
LDRLYKPFRDELIKHGLSVFFQAHVWTFKQITKHRNFEIGEIVCHFGVCAALVHQIGGEMAIRLFPSDLTAVSPRIDCQHQGHSTRLTAIALTSGGDVCNA